MSDTPVSAAPEQSFMQCVRYSARSFTQAIKSLPLPCIRRPGRPDLTLKADAQQRKSILHCGGRHLRRGAFIAAAALTALFTLSASSQAQAEVMTLQPQTPQIQQSTQSQDAAAQARDEYKWEVTGPAMLERMQQLSASIDMSKIDTMTTIHKLEQHYNACRTTHFSSAKRTSDLMFQYRNAASEAEQAHIKQEFIRQHAQQQADTQACDKTRQDLKQQYTQKSTRSDLFNETRKMRDLLAIHNTLTQLGNEGYFGTSMQAQQALQAMHDHPQYRRQLRQIDQYLTMAARGSLNADLQLKLTITTKTTDSRMRQYDDKHRQNSRNIGSDIVDFVKSLGSDASSAMAFQGAAYMLGKADNPAQVIQTALRRR